MKLEYEIEKQSTLAVDVLMQNILAKLKKEDYTITMESDKTVSFKLTGWGVIGKQFDKVSEGEFVITDHEDIKFVKFRFSNSVNPSLILFIIALLLGISISYHFLLLAVLLPLILLLQWVFTKGNCQIILNEILAEPIKT